MFMDNFKQLCWERGTTPTTVCKRLGISSGSPTAWAKGVVPRAWTVQRIAEYFGVSSDELMYGKKEEPVRAVDAGELERAVIKMLAQLSDDGWRRAYDFLNWLVKGE